jgi:PH (Pleckstrin Homology) domain-containing protein
LLILRPRRALGTLFGAIISALLLVPAVALVARVASEPVTLTSFTAGAVAALLLILTLTFAYWTFGCWSLHYGLDRNALTIGWAGNRYRIPLKEITALEAPDKNPKGWGGIWWPGHAIGPSSGALAFVTEGPPILITTPAQTFVISPPDLATFAEELNIRARLGPTEDTAPDAVRWWPWDLPIWHDRTALPLLAASLLLNFALFAHQALAMPALADLVPVHFTALGFIDRAGPKAELFEIPLGGLVLLIANTGLAGLLHRVEPFAAYLALAAGLVVQLFLWAAWLRVLA